MNLSLQTGSPDETTALGRCLGQRLRGGWTLALTGPLGAGKTHLVQGIAAGMGITEPLASPTFLLHKTYEGRLRLHHFDFYRLDSLDDLESIGFFDIQAQDQAIIVIEWAEKFRDVLEPPLLEVQIAPIAETARSVSIAGHDIDPAWLEQIAGWNREKRA